MSDMSIRLNRRAGPALDRLKDDIKRIMGLDEISNSQAIEIFLSSPKVVILSGRKKRKKLEIRSL